MVSLELGRRSRLFRNDLAAHVRETRYITEKMSLEKTRCEMQLDNISTISQQVANNEIRTTGTTKMTVREIMVFKRTNARVE